MVKYLIFRRTIKMVKAIFRNPEADENVITDLPAMKKEVIDNFNEFWMQGSGDGYIEFWVDEKKVSMLMLGPNLEYGLYLHYISCTENIDLLSLYDANRLDLVAETADEIYASIGLFLPKEDAWEGIQYFVETGQPFPGIEWITPNDIPENGNW